MYSETWKENHLRTGNDDLLATESQGWMAKKKNLMRWMSLFKLKMKHYDLPPSWGSSVPAFLPHYTSSSKNENVGENNQFYALQIWFNYCMLMGKETLGPWSVAQDCINSIRTDPSPSSRFIRAVALKIVWVCRNFLRTSHKTAISSKMKKQTSTSNFFSLNTGATFDSTVIRVCILWI